MEDNNPTTVAPADDTGADAPILPDEDAALPSDTQADSTAETTASEQEQTSSGDEKKSLPDEIDDKLKRFAKGQGIDDVSELSPREMSLLKSAYDNKAEQDRARQKASQLEKSLVATPSGASADAADPDLRERLDRIEMTQNVNTFFAENPDAKALEEKMANIVTERPEIGQLVKSGYLSVSDLYDLARGSDTSRDEQLKADGGREALKKVASKQQAKAVPGHATSSQLTDNEPEDAFLKAFESN